MNNSLYPEVEFLATFFLTPTDDFIAWHTIFYSLFSCLLVYEHADYFQVFIVAVL